MTDRFIPSADKRPRPPGGLHRFLHFLWIMPPHTPSDHPHPRSDALAHRYRVSGEPLNRQNANALPPVFTLLRNIVFICRKNVTNGSHKARLWPEKVSAARRIAQYFTQALEFPGYQQTREPSFATQVAVANWRFVKRLCHDTNATNSKSWLQIVVGFVRHRHCLNPDLSCQECVWNDTSCARCLYIVLLGTNSSLETSGLGHNETSAVPRESSLHLTSGALPAICVHAALSQLQLLPPCQMMRTFLMCLANAPSHTLGHLASLAQNPRAFTFGPFSPFSR